MNSRIQVCGLLLGALVTTSYDVLALIELGSDFRISEMGPDGDIDFAAENPSMVFNPDANEYFIVWSGADDSDPSLINEKEIYGQRINAVNGELIGGEIRLSDMGPDGDESFNATNPDITYNSINHEYFIVWQGDDDTALQVDGEGEIYGQRVDAVTGTEIGSDTRLSDMGPDGDSTYDAKNPAVTFNSTNNEYFVVWKGDDDTGGLLNQEQEIHGQRVDAVTGKEIGNDIRLSEMGIDGDVKYNAGDPDVTYNSIENEYLVVWPGDDIIDGDREIHGQRVDADSGFETGEDIRLSDMGPEEIPGFSAGSPAVSFNITNNEYFVVWTGEDTLESEFEIYGQRVDAITGDEKGGDLRLSDMGPDGDISFTAFSPAVSYNDSNNEYLVVWEGKDDIAPLVDIEDEVYYQRVDALTGSEIGEDTRLSNMGPDGSTDYFVATPAISYNINKNEYFVVWSGTDDTLPLVANEKEVFGQRLSGPATLRFTSRKNQVDENVGNVQIEVQRVGGSSNTVTVDFSTTDGTAIAPDDYAATSGTLTFAPDERSRKIALSILDNDANNSEKVFSMSLSNVLSDIGEVQLDVLNSKTSISIIDDETTEDIGNGSGGGSKSSNLDASSGSGFLDILSTVVLLLLLSLRRLNLMFMNKRFFLSFSRRSRILKREL